MQCNTNQKRNEYYKENKKSERAHNFTAESIYFVLWICMLYMYICVFYEARSLFRLVAINSSDVNDEKCAQIHTLHWLPTESPQRTMVAIEYYYFIRFSCSVFFSAVDSADFICCWDLLLLLFPNRISPSHAHIIIKSEFVPTEFHLAQFSDFPE